MKRGIMYIGNNMLENTLQNMKLGYLISFALPEVFKLPFNTFYEIFSGITKAPLLLNVYTWGINLDNFKNPEFW